MSKKPFSLLLIFLIAGISSSYLFAQSTLSGSVSNDAGEPLVGASVFIEELSLGTASGVDGKYTLTVAADKANGTYTLSVRYVGYATSSKEIVLSAANQTLDFVLSENFLTLDGIEVTALKSGATLATETPMSITVFQGKLVESMGASTISEFIQAAPGVTTTQLDESYMSLQIRGISSLSGDSPAGYYLDDLPFTFIGSPLVPELNPFDLDRVEVLRGPQGTLYGNGAQSGVVRILTQDANLSKMGLKVDISGAMTEDGGPNYGAQGAFNLPVIKDKLAVRLVGGYQQRGGFLTNNLLNKKEVNETQLTYFRGKVNFQATERLSIRASFWTQKNDVGTYALADDNFDRSTPFAEEANNNNLNLYNGTIEYVLPKLRIYSSTSYTKLEAQLYDGSPIFARSDTDLSQTALNEEFRLNSIYEGPFNWLVGFYYWNGEFNQKTNVTFILPPDGALFSQPYIETKSTSTQFAGFGEFYYKFLDNRMQATVGLRYFSEKRDLEDLLPSTIDFLKLLGIATKRGTDYKIFTPRFNLAFNPSKNSLLYITAANGFRSGFVQSGAFYASAVAFGIPAPEYVTEENLWSYELGTKITSPNDQFLIEAAVYYNDWSDLIQTTSQVVDVMGTPTPIIYFLNAGKASALGLDLTTQYSSPVGLTLTLGGNVNQSEYSEDTPASIGAKEGDRISFVPQFTLSSSAYYSRPVFGGLDGSVFANLQHSSKRVDYNAGNMVEGDDITMLNLRIGVEGKKWGVFLFGNNLLNDRGATYPHNLLTYDTRLRPRTLGINLKFNL
ncbi:MAG: TonB-dependent receptor [Saprospiraceae bacterium]